LNASAGKREEDCFFLNHFARKREREGRTFTHFTLHSWSIKSKRRSSSRTTIIFNISQGGEKKKKEASGFLTHATRTRKVKEEKGEAKLWLTASACSPVCSSGKKGGRKKRRSPASWRECREGREKKTSKRDPLYWATGLRISKNAATTAVGEKEKGEKDRCGRAAGSST